MARCQCMKCGETFNSESGFNAHRVGVYTKDKRVCLTKRGIKGKGMIERDSVWYWNNPGYAFKLDSKKSGGLNGE